MTKEELIGRKFQTTNGEVYSVSDYDNSKTVYITLLSTSLNPNVKNTKPTAYGVDLLSQMLTFQGWKLIEEEMLDYKQVDPKTVKFIFKDMKIAVSTTEENKWVQEVAFANGIKWSSGHTEFKYPASKALYFDKYGMSKTDAVSDFFKEQSNKEITIKDILANYKMTKFKVKDIVEIVDRSIYNEKVKVGDTAEVIRVSEDGTCRLRFPQYKEDGVDFNQTTRTGAPDIKLVDKIEVGDTVVYINHLTHGSVHRIVKSIVRSVKEGYDSIYYVEGGFDHAKDLKVVSKAKQKEIIGYETVVDLPGIPKGTKSVNGVTGNINFQTTGGGMNSFNKTQFEDTKFFKPIYKSDAIELKFSKHTATLSKEHGLVFTDGEKLSFAETQKLIKNIDSFGGKLSKAGSFDVSVEFTINTVKVGCKSFTYADVMLVQAAVIKLQ